MIQSVAKENPKKAIYTRGGSDFSETNPNEDQRAALRHNGLFCFPPVSGDVDFDLTLATKRKSN